LIILSLQLEEDCLSIIRALKREVAAAIIVFSNTESPIDKTVALEVGADDYLEGLELRELVARIRLVLPRSRSTKP
jgi:DNA-binding response OmpR family regulator